MNRAKAIRLATRWAEGAVVTLREGEAREYHRLCLASLREQEQREQSATDKGRIRYKDFEIRECIGVNARSSKYEIVKWSTERLRSTGKPWCWVIAFIRWNAKEPCWQLDVVGTRFIDDYEDGLSEFIRDFLRDRRPEEEGAEG